MGLRLWAKLAVATLLVASARLEALAQPASPAATQNAVGRPELLTDPTTPAPPHGRPTMLPDSVPEPVSSGAIVLFGEYNLLWLRRQGNDYAIIDPNTDALPEGAIQSLNGGPQSGFRVGGAYRRGGSPWDLGFTYTFFRNQDAESIVAPPGGLLYATQTRPGLIETVDFASATARLTYDLYDLEIGRTYAVDDCLALRAQLGVRVADIGYDSLVIYDGRDAAMARVASGFQFTGAGLLVGGEAQWTVTKLISVFGRARGGLLVGANDSRLRETNNDGTVLDTDLTQHIRQTVPLLEMALGASVHFRRFDLRGGYEIANWFQLMSTPDIADDIHKGKVYQRTSNLGLDGFFLQLGMSF
jgi:hypothetical protein